MEASEVDLEVLAFIERLGHSLLKLDLIKFFAHNPNLMDTSSGIALRVGRGKEAVAFELYDLFLLGILEREKLNDAYVYYLSPDRRFRELLTRAISKVKF